MKSAVITMATLAAISFGSVSVMLHSPATAADKPVMMTDSITEIAVGSDSEYETFDHVAERFVSEKDYDGLYAYCTQVLEKNPNADQAYYWRAMSRYLRGDPAPQIIADLDRAIELDIWNVDYLNAHGHMLTSMNDFEGAATDFEIALLIDGDNLETVESLVDTYQEMESWEEVVALCDYWISLNPNSSQAFYARGMASIELDDYVCAISDLEKTAELYIAADRMEESEDLKELIAELRDGGNVS